MVRPVTPLVVCKQPEGQLAQAQYARPAEPWVATSAVVARISVRGERAARHATTTALDL
jgi:hypothetical protein